MKPFISNTKINESITYNNLLQKVSNVKTSSNVIREKNPIHFYLHLIINIYHQIDSIILDDDISLPKESLLFTEKEININPSVPETVSWDIFLEKFKKSNSNISLFTSGTTGTPKKVTHTASKFIEMARVGNKYQNHIWALLYNPKHMAGLQVFFQAILNKNTLVYLFQCTRDEFIKTCKENKISHISATPTFYRLLAPFDFSLDTIQKCTLGGEKSDLKLIAHLKKCFPKAAITNIYASTEAGSLFVSNGDTFKIIENLKDKIKFVNNEIVIHTSLLGDFNSENEWYCTGDMVEFIDDLHKEFRIVSRKSATVNIGGNRVNLMEVETVINQVEGVVNAVVYTQDNSVLGKIIACNIISNKDYTKKEFKGVLKKQLPFYKIPTKIQFVQELETTYTGKVKRS